MKVVVYKEIEGRREHFYVDKFNWAFRMFGVKSPFSYVTGPHNTKERAIERADERINKRMEIIEIIDL